MDWHTFFATNWHVKIVALALIWAAYIDGKQLRVPNWLTFPFALLGIAFNVWVDGWTGFGSSMLGMVVGLACLLPLYSIGGMGAGDVKLMAGIGAWLGATVAFNAFCVSTVVGAVMAVAMVLYRKDFAKHYANFFLIWTEIMHVKNPAELSKIAAARKPSMLLLPYGIPICIGSIAYFVCANMI